MKALIVLLLASLSVGFAHGKPPVPKRADFYKELYLDSMFVDPPPPEDPGEEPDPFPDWVLVGVSKYVNKTEVEIMNIKDRTRVRIPSPEADEMGFRIKSVEQGRNFIDDSKVVLTKGPFEGEVLFKSEFLVLKKAAGPTNAKAQKGRSSQNTSNTKKAQTDKFKTPPIPGQRPQLPQVNRPNLRREVPRPSSSTQPATTTKSRGRTRYIPKKK